MSFYSIILLAKPIYSQELKLDYTYHMKSKFCLDKYLKKKKRVAIKNLKEKWLFLAKRKTQLILLFIS